MKNLKILWKSWIKIFHISYDPQLWKCWRFQLFNIPINVLTEKKSKLPFFNKPWHWGDDMKDHEENKWKEQIDRIFPSSTPSIHLRTALLIVCNRWRLGGPHINIVAVIFERVNMFVFIFNIGAGNVNVAGSFLY